MYLTVLWIDLVSTSTSTANKFGPALSQLVYPTFKANLKLNRTKEAPDSKTDIKLKSNQFGENVLIS